MSNAAFLESVGGRLLPAEEVRALYGSSAADDVWDFGWIPPERRTPEETAACEAIEAAVPDLQITGAWQMDRPRYSLWAAHKRTTGKFLPYNWQITGSCVGAGGGNMAKTLVSVQVSLGLMEYRELFWLFTYGKSRQRSGSRGRGEGSTGSGYAEAATQDGYVAFDEDPSLGQPSFKDGWLQFSRQTELQWSDGAAAPPREVEIGRTHLIRSKARARSHADVLAGLANGYPATQASSFGTRRMVPSPQGDPPVRLAEWDGSWNHQTYFDEVWDHPTLGIIFRWGNNWGPGAHGEATGDEPAGGMYLRSSTVDRICRSGEVFVFSPDISGFPARSVPWIFT